MFHVVNPLLVITLVHKKVTCRPEVATFRTKTLNFTRVIHLNWLAKIKLRGLGPPDCQIVVNYCFTCVLLLYAKMLKETDTEETIGFLSHFYNRWYFN